MEESTMTTLNIELANAITRDREREFRDHTRFGDTRHGTYPTSIGKAATLAGPVQRSVWTRASQELPQKV
jgi:hypothetical protein